MAKKILLADDSITIQKVVELTFSDGDYEVTAVNNGAKAIQKLSEMRPDIILSDIIMPEKNGYEVCEFVKSHPDYRTIPIILLTGTFEPFDPDRADKAGCDAVVTKPFESQSLIHKVEELIDQARSNAPTAPSKAMTDEAPPPAPAPSVPVAHDSDIFGAPPPPEEFSGETRALPKINFEEMSKESSTQKVPAQPAPAPPSPWDEQPSAFSGETRAFPRMNFEEMQRTSQPPAPPASASESESPFGESPSAESFSGETRAFPKLSFDDLQKSAPPPAPSAPEPPKAPMESAPSPWGEQPSFPRATFDEIEGPPSQKVSPSAPAPSASPWDELPAPSAPAWSPMSEPSKPSEPAAEEPAWAAPPAASTSPAPSQPSSGNGTELTDEQIDRIARRVVQLMSDQVVRNIAWEVIPDLAEMVVKERIRQLETE